VQISLRTPAPASRRALVGVAHVLFATIATRAVAQDGKVSPTGLYQATLSCGAGVATEPGPNGENYTSVGVQVFDASAQQISRPVITCGQTVVIGGAGAATLAWYIFVFNKVHTLVKQCESKPNTPISGGRFVCKAGGNVSATLTTRPQ
jgi:hypothetical protein